MILRQSDLWTSDADVILVTTNATINRAGELVMGRGAALEAKLRFPDVPKMLARRIPANGRYGVIILAQKYYTTFNPGGFCLGAFQVKYGYAEEARLDLIENSAAMLAALGPVGRVAMNFPGTGWGGLKREDVLPIIERLPDSVEVHEMPGKGRGRLSKITFAKEAD